jgi:hypothetical protein
MRPSLRSWRGLGLAVLVTVLLAPPAIRILALGVPDAPLWADLALLEIDTLHAARAPHLVGPYSRFMWHHPGPAYAYLLLPLYEAFGERSGGLFLGALAIALASALGLVGLGVAMAGYGYGVWSVALLALWVLAFGPARLASIWNPHVVVLPFALLIVASAALAAGRVRLLPFVVFMASFLVQTHLGCLPGAGLLVAIAGAMYALRRRTAGPSAGERSGALLALAVLAVAWALPLYEQATADHGNLRDVARFVGSRVRPHPLGEIAPIVSGHLASIPLALITALGGPPPAGVEDGLATALAVPALMLAPVAAWAARRRDRAFVEGLCIVSGALAVAAYGIGTRIKGPAFDYLLLWASAPGLTLWCGLGGALAPVAAERAPVWLRRAGAALGVIAAVAAVGIATAGTSRVAPPEGDRDIAALGDAVIRAAAHGGRVAGPPLLRVVAHDSWPVATGIAAALYKRSVPFTVDPEWLYMFGRQFRPAEPATREIHVGDRAYHDEAGALPDRRLVAAGKGAFVYLLEDPAWVGRHRWPGRGRVVAARGTSGEPSRVVDGVVPAEGSRWNGPACVVVARDGFVTVTVPAGPIGGARISADGTDAYRVLGSSDGTAFTTLGTLRRVGDRGMRARILWWGDRPPPRYLRVEPAGERDRYAIGEIEFLARP